MAEAVTAGGDPDVSERQLNEQAAEIFRECAGILQHQAANPFRVNAYVRAANVLDSLQDDVRELLDREGIDGLVKLPGIGKGLAAAIDEIARTGRLSQLDRLRGEASPETLFQTLPGVGRKLAEDIHETLHVDTLEALENAAHDGSLLTVPGIGDARAGTAASQQARSGAIRAPVTRDRRPLPQAGRRRGAAEDCAQTLQPRGQGMAADPARRAGGLAFHGAVLEYRPRS